MTHSELVDRAKRWLRNTRRCAVVVGEVRSIAMEEPDAISRIVKAELRKAGLGHLRLHDLRHTFASEFIRQSGNIRVLQDLLGHTQASTTQIYTHVADSHLKAEIGRVSFIVDVGGKKK